MKRIVKFIVWASFFVYLAVVAGLVFFSRYRVGFIEDVSIWEYLCFLKRLSTGKNIP